MRLVTRCLCVLALAVAGFAPVGAHVAEAATTPTLTVTPSTNLVDGQTVSLDGTGWQPGHHIVTGLQPRSDSVSNGFCLADFATADGSGSIHLSAKVVRFECGETDCANPATPCQYAAQDNDQVSPPFDSAKADISFAPVDLTPPVIIPGGGSNSEGTTGMHKPIRIRVRLSKPAPAPVTVQWNTVYINAGSPIEADPATDYTPASGTLGFGIGQSESSVFVYVIGDTLFEPDEWIVVSFHDPTNATIGGFAGLAFGVIGNDDVTTVMPGGGSVVEGNTGTSELHVPVTLSNASSGSVAVQWNTVFLNGGSSIEADPASDYTSTSGTVVFAPGETAKSVTISVNGDSLVEPDEWIVVSFHDPVNATVGGYGGMGFGVITNDDG